MIQKKNPFALRAKIYRSISLSGTWYALAIMDDDKLNWRDTPETLALIGGLTWVWWDVAAMAITVNTTPLVVVEAAVVTGLIASIAIGGKEGGETYVDYITSPIAHPIEFWKDEKKVESLVLAHEIVQGIVNPVGWGIGKGFDYITAELEEKKEEIFKNRWLTGPYLPF